MKRWPIIRHVRWLLHLSAVIEHYQFYRSLGLHSGNLKHDMEVLDMIWRGEY